MKNIFTNNINSIALVDCSADCLCLDVSDLAASSIAGGLALAGVEAIASASGSSSYAGTNARTYAKQLSRHISIAFGRGNAVAIGDHATANVNVYGEGDKVIQRTYTRGDDGAMYSRGFVVAIDYH
jgi:hypothetical protein